MPDVDLIVAAVIAVIVALGATGGIARTLPFAAFAGGAVLGAAFAPRILPGGTSDDFALAVALPAALIAGGIAAALVEHSALRMRRRMERLARRRTVNILGGAVLGAWVAVVTVWLLGAIAEQIKPARDELDDSEIIAQLDDVLAAPGVAADETKRPTYAIPETDSEVPAVAPADVSIVNDPDVLRADRSVVRIFTVACGGFHGGTGWMGADGVVVTNAHVTAGADQITVRLLGGSKAHKAEAIWFDTQNDVSLIRVPGLKGIAPLKFAPAAKRGTVGATIGFPLGRHSIRAARIAGTSDRFTGRIRDLPEGFRAIIKGSPTLAFRGTVAPGNSGGPLVDTKGRVLGTVWGGAGLRGGLAVPNKYARRALRDAGPVVSTGEC